MRFKPSSLILGCGSVGRGNAGSKHGRPPGGTGGVGNDRSMGAVAQCHGIPRTLGGIISAQRRDDHYPVYEHTRSFRPPRPGGRERDQVKSEVSHSPHYGI